MTRIRRCAGWALAVSMWMGMLGTQAQAAPALADPATGGAGGGPVSILFLGTRPQMDKAYAAQLKEEGFVYTNCSFYEPLTYEFVKRFNVIVIDEMPHSAAEFDTFGQRLLHFWANMKHIWRCADEGAGVLVYSNVADGGGARRGGWNREMKPWGIQILQSCIRDKATAFEHWQVYGGDCYHCWTEKLEPHQVTAGLKRLYYVSANLRWDDCYTAPPFICDRNWTPLVRGMPTASLATQVDEQWIDEPLPEGGLVLAAARAVGKGRLAALSINPKYIHQSGFTRFASKSEGEMSYGLVDGIVLKKGDGSVPSDTGAFVSRLYAWLAGDSGAHGFGGYKPGEPVQTAATVVTEEEKKFSPVLDFDPFVFPPSWKHRPTAIQVGQTQYYPEFADPLVPGEIKYFKALIGAHTALSDGAGKVADFAREAKQAGYSLIVFTENFEQLSREKWDKLVAECEKNSAEEFICLPGFDIQDPDGNHFILIAPPFYPKASWLSADGKRLTKVQVLSLLYDNHLVVAHRPAAGPLPQERLKHFQGLSVCTYREGKLVDDGMRSYVWQVLNASMPLPVSVHEILSPSEVRGAAAAGFQQILPSDTLRNGVAYFRAGLTHFFEAPARYMLSEGPIVFQWVSSPKDIGPASENRTHFRVGIGVRSDVELSSVTLWDGPSVLRRWLPAAKEFVTTADFPHAQQYDLYVTAEDSKGRRALTASLRTVPERYHYRCADRQNWLGDIAAHYPGLELPNGLDISLPVKGTAEASSIFTATNGTCMALKLNFPFTCNDLVLTECLPEDKYTWALRPDVGADAMPSRPSRPSDVYKGRLRYYSFTPGVANKPWNALVDVDLELKRDVEPSAMDRPFPYFGLLRGTNFCRLQGGELVTTVVTNDAAYPVPAGSLAGGYVALSDGLEIRNRRFGLAMPPLKGNPGVLPAGTRLHARFLMPGGRSSLGAKPGSYDGEPNEWLRAMGFGGPTAYEIKMTRGTLDRVAFLAEMTPENSGAAGRVDTTATLPYEVPLQLRGLNERWPAGIWREGGELRYTGVFEQTAWPRLDVSRRGRFYAGNLLTSDNGNLVLSVVKWTRDAIRVEVHNPTDATITAAVATPGEITDLKPLSRQATVPAGATLYIE